MKPLQGRDRRFQEWDPIERRAEDLVRVRSEVSAQDLLVHRAKVDRELEVAGRVEAGQARLGAVEPALDLVADEQQRSRGPMVPPAACGLLRAPAVLGPEGA